jgi:hypothetical protein
LQTRLNALRSILHLIFELAQFIELDLALDVGFDIADLALGATNKVANGASNFR